MVVTSGSVVLVVLVVLVEVVEDVEEVLLAAGPDVLVDLIVVVEPAEVGGVGACVVGTGAATWTTTVEEPWTRTPPTPWPQATTRSEASPGEARLASQLRLKSALDVAGKVRESTIERPTSSSTRETLSAAVTLPRTVTTPLTCSPGRGETTSTDAALTPGPGQSPTWASAGAGATMVTPPTMSTAPSQQMERGLVTLVMASFRARPPAAPVETAKQPGRGARADGSEDQQRATDS